MMFSNSDEVMEWLVNLSLCRPSIMMACLLVLIGLEGRGAVDVCLEMFFFCRTYRLVDIRLGFRQMVSLVVRTSTVVYS